MDISIHLLTAEEKKYAYYYSQQIAGQTGLIGRLRSHFDPDGESLNSTWEEYYTSLATPDFKATVTQVFNTLRYGPVYIDKHDCIILDGDKLRFDDGSVETIHTLETNVKGYCITNPDFLKHHPDAELKYTPLIANECTPELRKVRDVEIVGLKDQSSRHNDAFCGAILSSFSAFCAYCGFINDKGCGLRIDAGEYVFLLRLNPVMGQTNVDCLYYLKEWLDSHIHKARKGIRFISPSYEELFRIHDGDQIRIVYAGGEYAKRKVRYIDDYHIEIGSTPCTDIYHICEFAERMEHIGAKVEPVYVARIDYLGSDGTVRESVNYSNEEVFLHDLFKENYYGVPLTVTLYRDENDDTISTAFLARLDPMIQGLNYEG